VLHRRSAGVMPTYHVNVIGEHEFAKHDDNIASCRRWAAGAFPGKRVSVCLEFVGFQQEGTLASQNLSP
jgi:hypothetical protein